MWDPQKSRKLAPHVAGPFPISKVINPTAVWFLFAPCHVDPPHFPCLLLQACEEEPTSAHLHISHHHCSLMVRRFRKFHRCVSGLSIWQIKMVPALGILDLALIIEFHRSHLDQPLPYANSPLTSDPALTRVCHSPSPMCFHVRLLGFRR